MAHAAVSVASQKPPISGRRKTTMRSLHLLADPSAMTKSDALKLFRKFANRSPIPLGQLRAELIPDSSWKRATEVLGQTAAQTVARLAHALTFSTRTWQSEADAIDWLLGPHMELDGATPFSMLRTESGGRAVEYIMAALEYGFPV
jgi:putative toxin-antitoxin system antitoxin component (TIGR02293 family)